MAKLFLLPGAALNGMFRSLEKLVTQVAFHVTSHAIYIGGSRGGAPPYGSRFFRFDMQNFRNVAASGVHGPPYGKSWIRHWFITIIQHLGNEAENAI